MTILEVSGETAICLTIGDPVSHSLSPRMHNAAYHAAGLAFVMAAARVAVPDLPDAIRGARALNVHGLAVTMPHKVAITSLLDELDPTAQSIGAVNTVVNRAGRMIGYNTDWLGILRPLEHRASLSEKTVAVLGAGGAAQAAVFACASHGASVTIFNRTLASAQELALSYGAQALPLDQTQPIGDFDIVINTTAMGMGALADECPIDPSQLSSKQIVFETIYHPFETVLLSRARDKGATCIPGLEMFLEQGAAQFELHTGVKAPRSVMKTILENAVKG